MLWQLPLHCGKLAQGEKYQFMWQADLQGFANCVTDCLDVHANADLPQGQTSDQVWVAGRDVICLSICEPRQSKPDQNRQQVCRQTF